MAVKPLLLPTKRLNRFLDASARLHERLEPWQSFRLKLLHVLGQRFDLGEAANSTLPCLLHLFDS